jgi:hypothetical protein
MEFTSLHHQMPPVNSAEYQAYHKAVRRKHGKPSEYPCSYYECPRYGRDWAWQHDTDPANPDNYNPMCRLHHQEYDRPYWLKKEQADRRAEGERKGWTPERRAAQSARAKEQWGDGTLSRTEQSRRALRDRPWTGRRPRRGGGA